MRLEVERYVKCFVDSLHFFEGEEACAFGEAGQVDGGELVAHHQGAPFEDARDPRGLLVDQPGGR